MSQITLDDDSRVLEAAMEAGHILLQNGAEIFRVEETMDRICRYFGVESRDFFVLSNGIFTTGKPRNHEFFARVRHIPVKGAQLDKVVAVNQLSREIEEGKYTIQEVEEQLRIIKEMPAKPQMQQILASALGSGTFCYLFGGSLLDSAASAVAGFFLYIFVLKVSAPYLSKIIGNICGGAIVTLISLICYQLGFGENLSCMIIGSIIPLVPGVAFTNGIRDIGDGDYISGAVRLLDAILVFVCIAIGVCIVFAVANRFTGGIIL